MTADDPWTIAQLEAMDPGRLAQITADPSDPRYVDAWALATRRDPKMNKRERARLITRAKVMAAAHASYRTVGYNRTTARDIATAVGMSTASIFANWPVRDGDGGLRDLWRHVTGQPVPGDAPWTPTPAAAFHPGDAQ